jgi:hypothetical protein
MIDLNHILPKFEKLIMKTFGSLQKRALTGEAKMVIAIGR